MLGLRKRGTVTFDYGNNIRGEAFAAGVKDSFDIPGFVPEYIRPLFCEGKGPFRWAASPGIQKIFTGLIVRSLRRFRKTIPSAAGYGSPEKRVHFQGLPARICWLGYGERAKMGSIFNDLVATGRSEGPDRDRP